MANSIHCPHCGQTYQLTPAQVPQYAGQTITCTSCNKPFTVPAAAGLAYASPLPQVSDRYAPAAPTQSNPLAVVSLVCALVGLCIPILPGIAAIVTGIFGLKRTSDPRVSGKGIAIAGIVVGGVSILFSCVSMSILLPSLNRAREQANRVKCASNMKQIAVELQMYASSNAGQYPPDLDTLLAKGSTLTPNVFICPSSTDTAAPSNNQLSAGGHLSYVYIPGASSSAASSTTVVLYENSGDHGNQGMNLLFGNGTVNWYPLPQAQQLIAQSKAAAAAAAAATAQPARP